MSAPRSGAGWALAARLARREVFRRPWRTLLVALLVAVPVAGMMVAAVAARTDALLPAESWRAAHGRADALLTPGIPSPGSSAEEAARFEVTADRLPRGARMVSFRSGDGKLLRTTGDRRARTIVTDLPLGDALTEGIIRITGGRAPAAPDEVVLSRVTAGDLDAEIGDVVTLERPLATEITVVGIGERTEWYGSDFVVAAPASPLLADRTGPDRTEVRHLVDLPEGFTGAALEAWATTMRDKGLQLSPAYAGSPALAELVYGQYSAGDGRGSRGVRWAWVLGAVAFTVVGIVIASAFASGARRQLTTLGQLAANGAAPRILGRVLFLQGTWTGLVGGALGLVLGAAALAAAAPHRESIFSRDPGGWVVHPTDLVPIIVIGVVAATLSALVPARTMARVPVLAALAGRRPLGRVPRWLPAAGILSVSGGLALFGLSILGASGSGSNDQSTIWALTGIAGGVAVLLGACAVTPALVSLLEPLAGRLSGTWRLAARSLARQRTRTSAVISAVAATAALAIAGSSIMLGAAAEAAEDTPWQALDEVHVSTIRYEPFDQETGTRPSRSVPTPADLVARVAESLPGGADVLGLHVASSPEGLVGGEELTDFTPAEPKAELSPGALYVGPGAGALATVADETAATVYRLTAAERKALQDKGALYFGHITGTGTVPLVDPDDPVPVESVPGTGVAELRPGRSTEVIRDVAVIDATERSLGSLPRLLLTPARATALGLTTSAGDVVIRASRTLNKAERNLLTDVAMDISDETGGLDDGYRPIVRTGVNVPYLDEQPPALLLDGILSGVALLLTLFVVATSLGLAAAETRDERDVLAVVGASPSTMRRSSARKAAILTGAGALFAVPVGFLPVVVYTKADPGALGLFFPWRVAALLTVVVPLVAYLATTVGSASMLRLRPVRVSTMAVD